MPARAVTITMRDKAQATIKQSAATLSDRFGVALEEASIYDGKDQDYLRAKELARIADFLSGLAQAGSPESLELEAMQRKAESKAILADSLKVELDNALAEIEESNEAFAQWAVFGQSVQELLWAAVEDDDLRTALIESGFIEAEFAETRGWTISVAGIGPDLAGMIERHKPTDDPVPELPNAVDLTAMKRAELNAMAADLGIEDADKLPNKDAVIAAIDAKKGSA